MSTNQIFKIKRNDTLPPLTIQVKQRGSLGEVINFNMSGLTSATFTMVDECGNSKIYAKSATTLCTAEQGLVSYNWGLGDTDTSGTFLGEFELTFFDGNIFSIPPSGGIRIEISDDLNSF